jgi:hypothetical protein
MYDRADDGVENEKPPAAFRRREIGAVCLFFVVAVVLVFAMSMHKDLDPDESPFIASGAILSRHGTLPYRDYHYNHMPAEVMVYALLFKATSHLLLAARAFQSVCGAGTATVLFAVALGAFATFGTQVRVLMAWVAGLAMLCNPLFTRTAGICWNHDFPLLMSLLGFLCLCRGLRAKAHVWAWTFCAGLLLAIAITSRLTFAPITAGFVLLLCAYPGLTVSRRLGLLLIFTMGMALASLPSAWVWAQSPGNAFFGNFLYPHLNTRVHSMQPDEQQRPYTLAPIILFYFKMWFTLPGNGILTIAFILLVATTLRLGGSGANRLDSELVAIAVIVALLLAAGVMPAPPYPQYFYAPTPFMILGVVLCLARPRRRPIPAWAMLSLVAGLVLTVAFAIPAYRGIAWLPLPNKWVPMVIHAGGVEVAEHAGAGTILTLEPVYPLEGGLDIDPRFTTGRFGFRAAELLSAWQRAQYLMPAPQDIPRLFEQHPPRGVLVVKGTGGKLDKLLISVAEDNGYRQILLKTPGHHNHPRAELWLRPAVKPSTEPEAATPR